MRHGLIRMTRGRAVTLGRYTRSGFGSGGRRRGVQAFSHYGGGKMSARRDWIRMIIQAYRQRRIWRLLHGLFRRGI